MSPFWTVYPNMPTGLPNNTGGTSLPLMSALLKSIKRTVGMKTNMSFARMKHMHTTYQFYSKKKTA